MEIYEGVYKLQYCNIVKDMTIHSILKSSTYYFK